MVRLFGSAEAGKASILRHWEKANQHDPKRRFRPEVMAGRSFPYPYSTPGLLACKAAEWQGGQAAHWDYFDRLQYAHFTECRNIAEWDTLLWCANEVGLDLQRFQKDVAGKKIREVVFEELQLALEGGIHVVPTLCVEGHPPLRGAVTLPEIVQWLVQAGLVG